MSNVTIHLVIPVLVVVMTRLFPTRTVLIWAPFALLPDLDFIFNLFGILAHRAALHNYLIILPSLVTGVVLWRRMLKRRPELASDTWSARWQAFGAVRWGYGSVLVSVFLFSHVLLDMFTGGVTPFWPLWNTYVYPRFILWVNMETLMPRLQTEFVTGTGAPTLVEEFPWLTPEQIAIWLIVLIGAGVALWRESIEKKQSRQHLASEAKKEAAPLVVWDDEPPRLIIPRSPVCIARCSLRARCGRGRRTRSGR